MLASPAYYPTSPGSALGMSDANLETILDHIEYFLKKMDCYLSEACCRAAGRITSIIYFVMICLNRTPLR